MGKKAQGRSSIPAKENISCIRNFINIFEFSRSYSPHKLLADRKLESAKYPGSSYLENNDLEHTYDGSHGHDAKDLDVCGALKVSSSIPSVRTLIEEEMSKERILKASGYNSNLDQNVVENSKNYPDLLINNLLDSTQKDLEQLTCIEPVECSNFILDLAALIVEFYSISRHCPDLCAESDANLCTSSRSSSHKKNIRLDEPVSQLAEHPMLQDALVSEAEVFIRQKIDDAKHPVGNGIICSPEFMDALEILNANKELFPKLIQGPHARTFKHIQELLKKRIAEISKQGGDYCLEENANFDDKLGNSGQNGKSSSNQMFQKQKLQLFSKKKDKCKERIASKDQNISEGMSRIVVLKPRLSRNQGDSAIEQPPCTSVQSDNTNKLEIYSEKFVSHFSFREIKRKLKHIIGESRKEQRMMSRDGLLNRIPFGFKATVDIDRMTCTENNRKGFPTKTDCRSESICHSSPAVMETVKKSKKKEWQINVEAEIAKMQEISSFSLHEESFRKEADKNFLEKLLTDYRTVNLKNHKKSLENMLSLSDNIYSRRFSSVKELTLSTDETLSSPKLQLFSDTSLKETTGSGRDLDVETIVINSAAEEDKIEIQDERCNGDLNKEGIVEIIKIENEESVHINPAEPCNTSDIPAAGAGNISCCERCKQELCSMPPDLSLPNGKPRILIPSTSVSPSPLAINNFVSSEFIIEKAERPSPISVLEPFYIEDDASPIRPIIECAELDMPLQPIYLNNNEDSSILITTSDCYIPHQRCSYDMEAIAYYVKSALETYSFDSEMIPERLPSLELFLQSSVLDELRALNSYQEEPKLFLDCVNETLSEMKDWQFQVYPCVSFLESTVGPILKDLIIHEVCKTIESYLRSQIQCTLDDIMRKEMDSAMWMNVRLQMECIIAEISCSIFEELMEETIFELFL